MGWKLERSGERGVCWGNSWRRTGPAASTKLGCVSLGDRPGLEELEVTVR